MDITPFIVDRTFTAAATEPATVYDLSGQGPLPKHWTLYVAGVGAAATAWNAALQTSMDGVNWENTLTHISGTDADQLIKDSGNAATDPAFKSRRFARVKLNSVTLGPATSLRIVAVGTN